MTPTQKKLCKSLESGWLEHRMNGVYYYRSPGFRAKHLNGKTVAAVKAELPLVTFICRTPIRKIVTWITIREDKTHLLEGHYEIVRKFDGR